MLSHRWKNFLVPGWFAGSTCSVQRTCINDFAIVWLTLLNSTFASPPGPFGSVTFLLYFRDFRVLVKTEFEALCQHFYKSLFEFRGWLVLHYCTLDIANVSVNTKQLNIYKYTKYLKLVLVCWFKYKCTQCSLYMHLSPIMQAHHTEKTLNHLCMSYMIHK